MGATDTDANKRRMASNDHKERGTQSALSTRRHDSRFDEFLRVHGGMTDVELAARFETSVQSVQGMRRKINLVGKIADADGLRPDAIAELYKLGERRLHGILRKARRTK